MDKATRRSYQLVPVLVGMALLAAGLFELLNRGSTLQGLLLLGAGAMLLVTAKRIK